MYLANGAAALCRDLRRALSENKEIRVLCSPNNTYIGIRYWDRNTRNVPVKRQWLK